MNLNLLLLKLPIQKNQILLWESFTDIHLWTLLRFKLFDKNPYYIYDPDILSGNLTATISLSSASIFNNS